MKLLIKNGKVVNVFTDEIQEKNVLIEGEKIIGVGDYTDQDAEQVIDARGKFICPSFIDGHIHIESTMLLPKEFARAVVCHGTSAVVADPHEIANVCGSDGIKFMLSESEGLPMDVFISVPSCVPATGFDESGAIMEAEDIEKLYGTPRILCLAEMMNYPGVIFGDEKVLKKIEVSKKYGKIINGHAPLLSGKDLDKYLSQGITDDHECSMEAEAKERIEKGQYIMIRQGTAAKNLEGLISLFEEPYSRRCMLASDDKHPADLISNGHIDGIIREAVKLGKDPLTAIRMATIQPAQYYGLRDVGAVAPGYKANLLLLDNLEEVKVNTVFYKGRCVAKDGKTLEFENPKTDAKLTDKVRNTMNIKELSANDFKVNAKGKKLCNVIGIVKGQLLTENKQIVIDFDKNNGIDIEKDILKLAVAERHKGTGHIGICYIEEMGLKQGAIATSVSHDSHNLIVLGTNDEDMAVASNRVRELGGGLVSVCAGKVIAEMPLKYAGLMTDASTEEASKQNENVRLSAHKLGAPNDIEPFMLTAFLSLSVIPHIKLTTHGLVDVDKQQLIPLIIE